MWKGKKLQLQAWNSVKYKIIVWHWLKIYCWRNSFVMNGQERYLKNKQKGNKKTGWNFVRFFLSFTEWGWSWHCRRWPGFRPLFGDRSSPNAGRPGILSFWCSRWDDTVADIAGAGWTCPMLLKMNRWKSTGGLKIAIPNPDKRQVSDLKENNVLSLLTNPLYKDYKMECKIFTEEKHGIDSALKT